MPQVKNNFKSIEPRCPLKKGRARSSSNIRPERVNYKLFGVTGYSFHLLCDCSTPPWEDCKHTLEKFELEANNAMLEMLA